MSGPIIDLPLYICRWCKTRYLVDARMYNEPERCPKCGRDPEEGKPEKGEGDVEI
jgi:transcription initiation factor IIE alpha subunit